MIFIILYILIYYIVGVYLYNQKNNGVKYRKMHFLICFLLLFIFFGFRDLPILNDTAHYYREYQERVQEKPLSVFDINILHRYGVGYQAFVNFLIVYISKNPYTIIIVSSLFVSLFMTYGLKKYIWNIGLFCFFLLSSGNLLFFYSAIRQSLASIIFFFAYEKLCKGKYLLYIILFVIAFSFHNSAIILFLPLIFRLIKFNKRNLVVFVTLFLFAIYLMDMFIGLFGFGDTAYLDDDRQRETFPIAILVYVLIDLFYILCFYYIGKKYGIARPNDMTLWMSTTMVLLTVSAIPLGIAGRFSMYFCVFFFIMMMYYLDRIPRSKKNNYLFLFFCISMSRIIVELIVKPEWNHLYPFSFFDFFATSYETEYGY